MNNKRKKNKKQSTEKNEKKKHFVFIRSFNEQPDTDYINASHLYSYLTFCRAHSPA
jgi:hypothetical protein